MNKKVIAIVLATSFVVSGGIYYYNSSYYASKAIRDYVLAKDKDFCMRQFKEHQWLLFANPNPNMDHILDTQSPNTYEPQYAGKMKIKLLCDKGESVGFVTYYMESSFQGKILFLAIDSKFHGKGYGRKLMQYAIEQLKQMGAKTVKLFTRHENVRAQKLYESLGFISEGTDDYGIFYRKKL